MPKSPTQQFLEIENIRDGIIIMKNKTLRGVLMTSSLNFVLKSEEDQNTIIHQFQNLLNSLDFSLQVLVQSRRLNMTGYIEKLMDLEQKQPNELLKMQTKGYYTFIQSLVSTGTIMTKTFYLIVPFYPIELKGGSPAEEILGKSKAAISLQDKEFQRCKSQLLQRMEFLILGMRRCGLNSIALSTEELIEFFWGLYHPQEAEVGYYPEVPPELIKEYGISIFETKKKG